MAVLNNMGVKGFSTGVIRSFYFAFITTCLAAGLTYYLLARFFPQKSYILNLDNKFYEWTPEEVEVYAAGKDWRGRAAEAQAEQQMSQDESAKLDLDMGKKEGAAVVNVLDA